MQATSKSNTAVHSRYKVTEGLPSQDMSLAELRDIEREANRVFVDGRKAHRTGFATAFPQTSQPNSSL